MNEIDKRNNSKSEIGIIILPIVLILHSLYAKWLILWKLLIYFWNNVWYIYIFLVHLTYSIIFIVQVDKKE